MWEVHPRSIYHSILKQTTQLLSLDAEVLAQVRGQDQHSPLRKRALDQPIEMTRLKAQLSEPSRLSTQVHQEGSQSLAQDVAGAFLLDGGDVDPEYLRRGQMAIGIAGAGESKDGRSGDRDRDAVRDERLRRSIASVSVSARILTRDRIAHAMAEMHAGIAESDTCQRRRQQHLRPGLGIVRITDGSGKILDAATKCLKRKNVRDRVSALIGRPQNRIRWSRHPFVIGNGRPGLQRVAEDIEAGRGLNGGGHGPGVERVTDAQGRLQRPMGDPGLASLLDQVEDGRSRRLRTRPRGGRHRDERLERLADGQATTQRGIHKVKEVRIGKGGVQIDELGRVDDAAATDGQQGVGLVRLPKGDGRFDATRFPSARGGSTILAISSSSHELSLGSTIVSS